MPWNKPSRLGVKIRMLCSDAAQYPDEGQALFIWLARQVTRASQVTEQREMTDEQAGKRPREVLDSVVAMVLGIR